MIKLNTRSTATALLIRLIPGFIGISFYPAFAQKVADQPLATTEPFSRKQQLSPGVTYTVVQENNQKIHLVRIDLSQPGIRILASSPQTGGTTVTDFAKSQKSLIAINGDFYSESLVPKGLAIGDGKHWSGTRDTRRWSFLACTLAGQCTIDTSGKAVSLNPAWNIAVGGFPVLIKDGVARSLAEDIACGSFCALTHPRTVVGLSKDKKLLLLAVIEGRQVELPGIPLAGAAAFLKKQGAWTALNLDGGGSSVMVVKTNRVSGRPFNEPEERKVANTLAIRIESDTKRK